MAIPTTGNPGVRPGVNSGYDSLRALIGDTGYQEYVPPNTDYVNYAAFSDAEIQALLDLSGNDLAGAVGYAFLRLAGSAAASAVEWASDDLKVNLSKTPGELRAIAQMWFERGSLNTADIFELVDMPSMYDWTWGNLVELETPPYYLWRNRDLDWSY